MTVSRLFLYILIVTASIAEFYNKDAKLDGKIFKNLFPFTSNYYRNELIKNLERQNWIRPAVKISDNWMGLLWINPESPFDEWTPYEYYWSVEQKKTVRSSIQQLLYHHQAKKNYISFLCKTAVKQKVLNNADAGKISKIYWKLDSFNSFDYTQSMLFDPKYSEYTKKNVDSKGIVKLKTISEKYLEDPKQERLLRWKFRNEAILYHGVMPDPQQTARTLKTVTKALK